MDGAQFLVQWDEHPSHLATRLGYLLEHQSLVDVTLMCNTHTLKVHRAVLAACSPYFERQLGNHPLIVLKDMKFSVLKSLVEFMYCGETSVSEENLTPLLEAAKFFEVKGLSSMTKDTVCSPSSNPGIKPYNGTSTPTTSGYGRGSGRGRGRGRGRPPLNPSTKVGSPTESAQILLSLSGNTPSPQLYTTSKNVKIDPAVVAGTPGDGKPKGGFEPRRRGRKRGALNTAFRDRIMRDVDTQLAIENLKRDLSDDGDSPLLSSLLNKQDSASKQEECSTTKYMQQLKDIGLPTNVPILLDNGEGKLLTLTEDVLKTVVDSEGNLQLQVTESSLNKVKKPSRPFIVKEMRAIKSDDEEDAVMRNGVEVKTEASDEPQINEEMIESLKNGAVNEAELEPDAVVLYEVTENKKIEKYVVSAKEVSLLKSLTEQLVKQKKEAMDASKNNLSTIDIAGTNTKVAELKLNLGKTRSVLSQVVGLKDKLKHLSKSVLGNDASEKQPLSQMVQLEFIDGNGEKIEGYQVHGTLVEKRNSSGDTKENMNKDGDLMGLFDMVCGEGSSEENNPLLGENSLKKMSDKRDEEMLSGDNCDTKEMSYQLVNLDDQNENISYDQIEAMMNDTSGNIVIEEKSHQYIIDNDGSLMNQDENYVVYESENVIYHNTESVLPDISEGENSSNFVVGDTRVIQNEDGTEYIVYNDKGDLSEEIKGINERGDYIVYETDKSGYDDDGLVDVKENNGGFVIYSGDKKDLSDGSGVSGAQILEGVPEGLDNGGEGEEAKGSPTKDVPFAVGLVPLKDALEKFQSIAEHQPRKTRSNSINGETVGVRRRSSASSDTSDHMDKKRKLDLTDPPLPPSDEASL